MALQEGSMTPAPTQQSNSDNLSSSAERKARRSPRRMLSEDQKREVVRLYAETITPLEEIRRHFGIAESSLYRLIQQRGVPPRGRVAVVNGSALKSGLESTVSNGDVAASRQSAQRSAFPDGSVCQRLPPASPALRTA